MVDVRSFVNVALAGIGILAGGAASAQTQAQQNRVDELAEYVVVAPMCERLGMTVVPNLPARAEAAFKEEAGAWHLNAGVADRLMIDALRRRTAMFGTDLGAAAESAKTAAQLRGVGAIFRRYGLRCVAASNDPIFGSFVQRPEGYDLEASVTAVADSMLEGGGLASWQTPAIQTRGDLMMTAGSCRSKIGAARSDLLLKQYGQSDDPRVRVYYLKAFDEGLADQTIFSTVAGCNRAIARLTPSVR